MACYSQQEIAEAVGYTEKAIREFSTPEIVRDFVWSVNGSRRHLKTGQRALAYAKLFPEAKIGRPEKTSSIEDIKKKDDLSKSFRDKVAMARLVLRYDPQLAKEIETDATPLWANRRGSV